MTRLLLLLLLLCSCYEVKAVDAASVPACAQFKCFLPDDREELMPIVWSEPQSLHVPDGFDPGWFVVVSGLDGERWEPLALISYLDCKLELAEGCEP